MEVKLTIQEKLKDLRVERHLTLEELAAETGLSSSALGSYERDDYKDISLYAIITLAKFYGVSADYLLGITETKNHSNTDLRDLHLSDDMIDLLKEGRLNHRLLCELVLHPDFPKLMADIEIYVDRIASMQIDTLNSLVDVAQQKILEEYQPENADHPLKTLEASHINEEAYFLQRIDEDLKPIINSIRDAHKNDASTAQNSTLAEDIMKGMEEAAQFSGSDQERQARIFCIQLGINFNRLTTEEFAALVSILKKSKLLKSPISKRGKNSRKRKER